MGNQQIDEKQFGDSPVKVEQEHQKRETSRKGRWRTVKQGDTVRRIYTYNGKYVKVITIRFFSLYRYISLLDMLLQGRAGYIRYAAGKV
jgi:hypothetical protein